MVLLHYHVVPGLGDDIRPRPEATAVRTDQAAPAEGDDLALQASHPSPTTPPPTAGTCRAA
jgi:hypothetical protein